MANRIQIRHGSTTPTTSDLLSYELGWDDTNSRLYIKNGASTPSIITLNGPIRFGTGTDSAIGGKSTTTASGNYSFAFGATGNNTETSAGGYGAIAMGCGVVASNSYAIAIGSINTSSGQVATTIGGFNTASANYTVAIGTASQATAQGATAIGYYAIASSQFQTVLGKNNIIDTNDTYCLIVGNGSSGSNKSNAMTVDWSGNVTATSFTGSLTGNATNVTGTVAIANGGTGATTASGALTNLGISNVVLSDTSRKIYLTTTASVPSGAVTGDIVLVKV